MFQPSIVDTERRRLALGNPVDALALCASYWLESALAYHPERQRELDELSMRLDEATGEIGTLAGEFAKTETVEEQVVALERIVGVMRDTIACGLMRDPGPEAIIWSLEDGEEVLEKQ